MKQWIVVAGTDSARLFLRTSMTEPIVEIYNLKNELTDVPRKDLVRHPKAVKARSTSSHGVARIQTGERRSIQELVSEQFALKIAKTLNDGSRSSRFDSLVLISEPHFLGKLKSHLRGGSLKKLDAVIKRDWQASNADALSNLIAKNESLSALPIK